MIAVVVPIGMFVKFVGGGEVHTKEVVNRLSKTTDVMILPYIEDVINFNDKEICEIYEKLPYYFPKLLKRLCSGEKIKFEDVIKELSDEAKESNLIYEPNLHIRINVLHRNDKIKLLLKSFKSSIYCSEKLSFDAYCIAKKSNKKLVSVIHPDVRSYIDGLKIAYNGLKYHYDFPLSMLKITLTYRNLIKINKLVKDHTFKYLLSVSKAIEHLDIRNEKVKVLKIGNAFNPEIMKYRSKNKEDYIVFWARLYSLKGILEIPYIVREIIKKYDIKLKIFGRFISESEKYKFFDSVRKLNIEKNIEYLEFLSEEKKYEIVSKARALVYPSHSDSFSLVILESLALGTPVVAYNLLGPRSIYDGLPAIKFVKEFDIKGMAQQVLKLINMKDEDYYNLIYEDNLNKLLETHNSWDKVFEEIFWYLFE
ncbi:glycosyltransferase family 4 protein [Saccharolobus shibatae]|uniref:glycosyltransferase family 4 protein n=1 Tax=Saccharolobus shibatae TaxID=2286 RepID=UPI001C4901D6|nr:glycosyltransferase family 4 protein [Saccharolobus shibatae]